MRTALLWLWSALLLVAAVGQVVELSDDNFEHDTQVSTGATTGDWFVLLYVLWYEICWLLIGFFVATHTGALIAIKLCLCGKLLLKIWKEKLM